MERCDQVAQIVITAACLSLGAACAHIVSQTDSDLIAHGRARTGTYLDEIASHIDLFYTKMERLPDPAKDLFLAVKLYFPNAETFSWVRKKGDRFALVDAWDNEMVFSIVGDEFRIASPGPNGVFDGDGDDIVLQRLPKHLYR